MWCNLESVLLDQHSLRFVQVDLHHSSLNFALSQFSTAVVMSAIPEHIHFRLLEARDLWAIAKAEASLPSDTAVAYMLSTQHNSNRL